MAKIGEGHAAAMGRTGISELRNILYPESNIASRTPENGLFGRPTPGEVAEARRERDLGLEQEPSKQDSILASRLGLVGGCDAHGKDVRDPHMDR